MRRTLVLAGLAAVMLFATACDPALIRPSGAPPLRYRDPIFTRVTKTADVVYGSAQNIAGDTVTLDLDVYEPTGDTVARRPAIVWVHGGSFCCGDKTSGEIVDEANNFSKRGYVNFSINYRLEPGGCSASAPTTNCIRAIQQATEDAHTAVRFIRANAATYKVDTTRIAIGGSSAGAITALNVGFGSGEDPAGSVQSAVALSGAQLVSAPPGPGDAPSLLLHGSSDTTVPYQWAVNTVNNARAAGLYSYLTTWQGYGHVPYAQFHDQIIEQTSNFLYWTLGVAQAAR
jgi:acetyl esterase/lipase